MERVRLSIPGTMLSRRSRHRRGCSFPECSHLSARTWRELGLNARSRNLVAGRSWQVPGRFSQQEIHLVLRAQAASLAARGLAIRCPRILPVPDELPECPPSGLLVESSAADRAVAPPGVSPHNPRNPI